MSLMKRIQMKGMQSFQIFLMVGIYCPLSSLTHSLSTTKTNQQFKQEEGDDESPDSFIIQFDLVAYDSISYAQPVHRRARRDRMNPQMTGSKACLCIGGGMRDLVIV